MFAKAIDKLKSEMNKESKDAYIKVIGEFLIHHINKYPEAAEKILVEGKSIKKSLDEMVKVAKSRAVNGRAMLTDQEGFEIVLKYFGIKGSIDKVDIAPEVKPVHISDEKAEIKTKKDIDFDVKLEDFL